MHPFECIRQSNTVVTVIRFDNNHHHTCAHVLSCTHCDARAHQRRTHALIQQIYAIRDLCAATAAVTRARFAFGSAGVAPRPPPYHFKAYACTCMRTDAARARAQCTRNATAVGRDRASLIAPILDRHGVRLCVCVSWPHAISEQSTQTHALQRDPCGGGRRDSARAALCRFVAAMRALH